MKKFLGILVAVIGLGVVLFIYFRYYRVYAEGNKAGTLNYVVYKGWIWKTYEGEMILAGFNGKVPNTLQSNEFLFSIDNDSVASRLKLATGKEVVLYFRQYAGSIPWRGYSNFVVDSIVLIR